MHLSAQEEYGLRCLLRLASQGPGKSLTVPEISLAEGISIPYAAKMMRALRDGELVMSVRGQLGGYRLARPATAIPVSQVLGVLGSPLFEGEFCDKHAGTESTCTNSINCSIRALWRYVQKVVDQVLHKTTIQDLVRNEEEMDTFINNLVVLSATSDMKNKEVPRFG